MLHAKFPQPLPDARVEAAVRAICLHSKSACQPLHVVGKLEAWTTFGTASSLAAARPG
jgi:hypothetical protein